MSDTEWNHVTNRIRRPRAAFFSVRITGLGVCPHGSAGRRSRAGSSWDPHRVRACGPVPSSFRGIRVPSHFFNDASSTAVNFLDLRSLPFTALCIFRTLLPMHGTLTGNKEHTGIVQTLDKILLLLCKCPVLAVRRAASAFAVYHGGFMQVCSCLVTHAVMVLCHSFSWKYCWDRSMMPCGYVSLIFCHVPHDWMDSSSFRG